MELTEKFRQAKALGHACCLFTEDAELLDAANWDERVLCPRLNGDAWQQYVSDEHVGGVLMWLHDPDLTDPINFEMVARGRPPKLMYVSLTKESEGRLRFVIGAAVPVK